MARTLPGLLVAAILGLCGSAQGQPADAAALVASQVEAMRALAMIDGAWRGPATTLLGDGTSRTITQTERIGPFLGGAIKVIEGRGYDADGRVAFNAFGVITYDPAKRAYSMRSHALGRAGDFAFRPTATGYTWEIPAGPATIRYTATVQGGELHEVGDRLVEGQAPVRFFEMRLRRIGDSDWPAAGALAPR